MASENRQPRPNASLFPSDADRQPGERPIVSPAFGGTPRVTLLPSTPDAGTVVPRVQAGPKVDTALVEAMAQAIGLALPATSARSSWLPSVWRLPTPQVIGYGAYPIVPSAGGVEASEGTIQSISLLVEDPNVQIRLYLDGQDYSTTITELVQRQQFQSGPYDWTLTRQDPTATPPQYAVQAQPINWNWRSQFSLALAIPQSASQLSPPVSTITVDQLIIKRLVAQH